MAQEGAEARKGLEAARTAELAARKAAHEFEARAQLAEKDVSRQHSLSCDVVGQTKGLPILQVGGIYALLEEQ